MPLDIAKTYHVCNKVLNHVKDEERFRIEIPSQRKKPTRKNSFKKYLSKLRPVSKRPSSSPDSLSHSSPGASTSHSEPEIVLALPPELRLCVNHSTAERPISCGIIQGSLLPVKLSISSSEKESVTIGLLQN